MDQRLIKIKEDLYNKFKWRLSEREEQIIKRTLKNQHLNKKWRLSEREDYIVDITKEMGEA